MSTPKTSTTPFSGIRPEQVTDALVEQARTVARDRGDKQFGFRVAKTEPMHIVIVVAGGTRQNPTGAVGEAGGNPIDNAG